MILRQIVSIGAEMVLESDFIRGKGYSGVGVVPARRLNPGGRYIVE